MKLPMNQADEYSGIPTYKMVDNQNDDLPIYIRKYRAEKLTTVLHGHESIQVNYVLRGSLTHIINNSSYELVKGDIFIIPPYIPHRLAFKENCGCEVIELEFLPDFVFGGNSTMENIDTIFDFAYIEPCLVSECEVKPPHNLAGQAQNDG
ncbi:MAG: AraC family ligand binding domain-containing protein, partial [Clostridia bacterium]